MRFFSNIRPTRLSCSRETLPHGDAAHPLGAPSDGSQPVGFQGSPGLLTTADPIPRPVWVPNETLVLTTRLDRAESPRDSSKSAQNHGSIAPGG